MKAILLGLVFLIAAIIIFFILFVTCGVIMIFILNNNPWGSSYTPYNMNNIFDKSGQGLLSLFTICIIICVAYQLGHLLM